MQVTITVASGSTTVPALISEAAPGIFEWTMPDGKKRAVMLRPDGTLVTTTNPAHPGDIIRAFVTGMVAPAGLIDRDVFPVGLGHHCHYSGDRGREQRRGAGGAGDLTRAT